MGARERSVSIIPRLEKSEKLLALSKHREGRVLLIGLGIFLLWLGDVSYWWAAAVASLAIHVFPKQRLAALTVASAAWMYLSTNFEFLQILERRAPVTFPAFGPLAQATGIICAVALLYGMEKLPAWTLFRLFPFSRPFLAFPVLATALSLSPKESLATSLGWHVTLWYSTLVWPYVYATSGGPRPRSFTEMAQALGAFRSFAHTGLNFLSAGSMKPFESETGQEHVTLIRGLKLLLWAHLLTYAMSYFNYFVFHQGDAWPLARFELSLGLPSLWQAFNGARNWQQFPLLERWLAVLLSWPVEVAKFAIAGHFAVGALRLCGFDLLRNTWRPFESPTLYEYWRRVYVGFAQFLGQAFFLPLFSLLRGLPTRPRIYLSTFGAVCIGNSLYHLTSRAYLIIDYGLGTWLMIFRTFYLYSFLLALGIATSQVMSMGRKAKKPGFRARILSFAWLWLFFSIVGLFNMNFLTGKPESNFNFLASLFTSAR